MFGQCVRAVCWGSYYWQIVGIMATRMCWSCWVVTGLSLSMPIVYCRYVGAVKTAADAAARQQLEQVVEVLVKDRWVLFQLVSSFSTT